MISNLKALVVVLPIAMVVFIIAKPICLRFMEESDFARRRNVWFVLTVTAFTSPSFWLFVLVATPLLAWSARRDTNPVALYLLVMQVISPNVLIEIPVVGIEHLFALNNYRILSIAILIPAAWQLIRSSSKTGFARLTAMDIFILAWGVLQLVSMSQYESMSHTVRRGFLFTIDVLVLYFVVSRTCTSQRAITETMASFCLACAILAPLALFETFKGWLLYHGIGGVWGDPETIAYLFRANTLRAQVSAGHAIPLGYLMAIAFGFYLYLRSRVQSTPLNIAVVLWMWMGLLAAYSRAPWVVAVFIFFVYLGLGPNGFIRSFKVSLIVALFSGLVFLSPIGQRVIDNLPFVGSVDAENVTYRQRLAEMSWELIEKNPYFGDPNFLLSLESLRQGEGIIDLMNTYAAVGMAFGFVGLFLLLGPFIVGIWNTYRLAKRLADPDPEYSSLHFLEPFYFRMWSYSWSAKRATGADPELSLLGINLIACMLGTLVMMATGSFGAGLAQMYWVLTGLSAAYVHYGQLREVDRARKRHGPTTQPRWTPNQG